MKLRSVLKLMVSLIPFKPLKKYLREVLHLKTIPYKRYGDRYFLDANEGNRAILDILKDNKPCLITRFGKTELKCVDYLWRHMDKLKLRFPKKVVWQMEHNAGFFKPTNEHLTRFGCDFLRLIENIDVLGVVNFWSDTEKKLMIQYNKTAKLVAFGAIGENLPFEEEPWTQYLEGKKVLVIHPFADQIKSQYQRREKLYSNPKMLPKFTSLQVIEAIQGLDKNKTDTFKDWFEALSFMEKQIDACDFDIALIGAGAFGIFLGDYIKKKGKQAVHIGGHLQILFGIKGARWNEQNVGKEIHNKYWVDVDPKYRPASLDKFVKAEGNTAYW